MFSAWSVRRGGKALHILGRQSLRSVLIPTRANTDGASTTRMAGRVDNVDVFARLIRACAAVGGAGCCAVAMGGWGAVQCEEQGGERSRTHSQSGGWRQDWANSESLGPFLRGLGVPGFAVILVDAIKTDLNISCEDNKLMVVDKTIFGTNTTEVVLGGEEVERSTRTGRKTFMLSGFEDADGRLTVQCRLFQRGPGWVSQQSWRVREDGLLEERMLLKRPGEDDIVVHRLFARLGADPATGPHPDKASDRTAAHAPKTGSVGSSRLAFGGLALAGLTASLYL
mmetsp:Transcript_88742/g.215121  ORF Transcript_88742/g.215121 Transcript_88742/m.215121 type:complete len:283 (-) Transcript_88742:7-855(-)